MSGAGGRLDVSGRQPFRSRALGLVKEGPAFARLDTTVTSNTVTTQDTASDALLPIDVIRVEAGATATDTGTVCANISGNTATGAGSQVDAPGFDINLLHPYMAIPRGRVPDVRARAEPGSPGR